MLSHMPSQKWNLPGHSEMPDTVLETLPRRMRNLLEMIGLCVCGHWMRQRRAKVTIQNPY